MNRAELLASVRLDTLYALVGAGYTSRASYMLAAATAALADTLLALGDFDSPQEVRQELSGILSAVASRIQP